MNIFPLSLGLAELAAETLSVPLVRMQDGSGSSHFHGPEGWIHGLSMSRVSLSACPLIARAVVELREHVQLGATVQVMVNKLDAGHDLQPHRDGLPEYDRFHLPIISHPDVFWWDELNGKIHMRVGHWHGPVPYCGILHSAGNPSPVDRVHVVADFRKQKGTTADGV